jgi:alcohol dehydrogenase class IV
MVSGEETYRPAFPTRGYPHISYGLAFPQASAKHVSSTFNASRVYILSSGSLARNTDALARLQANLGDKVVGTRIGMKSHTMWSEVLQVTEEARKSGADLLITLGAGSLTDAAKIVAFVC